MKIVVPSKKVFEFEIDGVVHSMRRPTVSEHENYVDAYQSEENRKAKHNILMNHLAHLGLPLEVSKGLDLEQLDFVISSLTESKKN